MLEKTLALTALLAISAFADIRSASNVTINKWGSSGDGNFFIQVDNSEFVDCNQKWIRVPTKEMWAQVVAMAVSGTSINYMVVERFGSSNNAVYNIPTTCRLDWVDASK